MDVCERSCSTIEVLTGLPDRGVIDDVGYIKIYLKSTTKVKKAVLDYQWVTMIAEIGGYTGLLLGISLVNLTNVLDKFIYAIRK